MRKTTRVPPRARIGFVHLPKPSAVSAGDPSQSRRPDKRPNVQVTLLGMMLLEGMCARNIAVAVAAQATGLKPLPIKMEDALAAKKRDRPHPGHTGGLERHCRKSCRSPIRTCSNIVRAPSRHSNPLCVGIRSARLAPSYRARLPIIPRCSVSGGHW